MLSDWQVSGVTQLLTGQAITPTCSSNNPGIKNTNPSLTDGITPTSRARCELTGEPIFFGVHRDPNMPFADQPHFNLAAFRMPQPNGSIGNFGNTPVGILRHPTWHQWDLTLQRRFPVKSRAARTAASRCSSRPTTCSTRCSSPT